jgi:hypothetical protein
MRAAPGVSTGLSVRPNNEWNNRVKIATGTLILVVLHWAVFNKNRLHKLRWHRHPPPPPKESRTAW